MAVETRPTCAHARFCAEIEDDWNSYGTIIGVHKIEIFNASVICRFSFVSFMVCWITFEVFSVLLATLRRERAACSAVLRVQCGAVLSSRIVLCLSGSVLLSAC